MTDRPTDDPITRALDHLRHTVSAWHSETLGFTQSRTRARIHLGVFPDKAGRWWIQWAVPSGLGHRMTPPIPGEGPFDTRKAAQARKSELREMMR